MKAVHGSLGNGDSIRSRLAAPGHASLASWAQTLAEGQSRIQSPYCVLRFCRYVKKMPDELLAWEESCLNLEDKQMRKAVLRALQAYLESVQGTYKYKMREFSAVKSFLDFHDAPLPMDKHFHVRGNRPPVIGTLAIEDVRAIVTEAKLRGELCMTSMILTQFQSFSGVGELIWINHNRGESITKHLRDNVHPIRIDMLRTRKTNPHPWFTFIGREAANTLREYFDKDRGWPTATDPIWLDNRGRAMEVGVYQERWRSLCRHIRLIPKKKGRSRGDRYGKNPHELRDLARSLVHKAHTEQHDIAGKKLLFDALCAEFWMGHSVDPLAYNKFWKHDPSGVRDQYLIAEPYLNILTGSLSARHEITGGEVIQALLDSPPAVIEQIAKLITKRE